MKTIIHDLNKADFSAFELPDENVVVLNADGHYAPCRGCFACWLKNTGFCVMDDSLKHAGALIGQSDPLIIISRFVLRRLQPRRQGRFGPHYWGIPPLLYLAGRPNHHIWGATRSENCCAFSFTEILRNGSGRLPQSLPSATGSTLDTKQRKRCFSKISAQIRGAISMKLLILNASPQKERRRFSIFLRYPPAVSSRPCQKNGSSAEPERL